MSMIRRSYDALLLLGFLLATGAGCTSYRIDNTLKPGTPADRTGQPRYFIESAELMISTNAADEGLIDFGVYDIGRDELTKLLNAESARTRPDVFSTSPDAVPAQVKITRSSHEDSMGMEGCVSCLTLTILPLRSETKTGYDVEVTIPAGAENAMTSAPVSFTRHETFWMSILPFGWIPVPGGSGERVLGDNKGIELRRKQMLGASVEATAIALTRSGASAWRLAAPEAPPEPPAEEPNP
ncbi:MAG: hypothetical protein KBA51_00220 [Kiritimatiellae bacterium]|nr:hypothetical protein [Kiritimatiellia bacterium]